jgi:hypothetical protein
LLVLVVLAGLGLLAAFGLDETTRTTRIGGNAKLVETISVINPNALIGLGIWIALWATFLPTGTLAWREPDALELESAETEGGFSEAIRDAVLGVALAAALAISLAAEANAAGLLFVPALALVGALGRRAAGQPAMPRQRRWRVAIGLALIVAFILIAIASSAPGG